MTARGVARIVLCLAILMMALGFQQAEVKAQDEPCIVNWGSQDLVFSAAACPSYAFLIGWMAASPGLDIMFMRADQITLTVEGPNDFFLQYTPPESSQFWQAPVSRTPANAGWECPKPELWLVLYQAPIAEELDAGVYTLTYQDTYIHPFTDGLQRCSVDGVPFGQYIYRGTQPAFVTHFTVTP
jgi:hypothetical protein